MNIDELIQKLEDKINILFEIKDLDCLTETEKAYLKGKYKAFTDMLIYINNRRPF